MRIKSKSNHIIKEESFEEMTKWLKCENNHRKTSHIQSISSFSGIHNFFLERFFLLKISLMPNTFFNVVYSWSFNSKFEIFILTKLGNFNWTISNLFQKRFVWNWTVLITSWSLFRECWEIGLNFHIKKRFINIVQNCSRIPFIYWISHLRKKIRPSCSFSCSII